MQSSHAIAFHYCMERVSTFSRRFTSDGKLYINTAQAGFRTLSRASVGSRSAQTALELLEMKFAPLQECAHRHDLLGVCCGNPTTQLWDPSDLPETSSMQSGERPSRFNIQTAGAEQIINETSEDIAGNGTDMHLKGMILNAHSVPHLVHQSHCSYSSSSFGHGLVAPVLGVATMSGRTVDDEGWLSAT